MTALPARRVLADGALNHPEPVDIPDEFVSSIEDAICAGNQIHCAVSEERQDDDKTPQREACVTAFIDPYSKEKRYAVEVWGRTTVDTKKVDHATRQAALDEYHAECDRLAI